MLPVIPGCSRAHITAVSMKKSPHRRFFTVFKLTENMRISHDQFLQHFDRLLLKLGNGDLPIAKLTESIHIPTEITKKYKMNLGLQSCNPLGSWWIRNFLTLMQTSMIQSNS